MVRGLGEYELSWEASPEIDFRSEECSSSRSLNLECELVTADSDEITVGQGDTGTYLLVSDLHPVDRPQIGNHETSTGVDDYSVVPAHVVVVQDYVIIWQATYPCRRRL